MESGNEVLKAMSYVVLERRGYHYANLKCIEDDKQASRTHKTLHFALNTRLLYCPL